MRLAKPILTVFSLLTVCLAHAQERYIARDGKIRFFSHAPLEDIEATNSSVLSIIDLEKGQVAVDLLIKAFEFEKKLMQEHFNENYLESGKFPKATFKGMFSVPENLKLMEDGTYEVMVKGELTIHGVPKPLETGATLVVANSRLSGQLKFTVKVADHDIKIPKVVMKNIADEVEVTGTFNYEPFKKG